MSLNKFLKCTCPQCGGRIEFPAEGIGQSTPCPHCGSDIELALDLPEPTSAGSARSLKWMVAGVIILAVGIVGVIGALVAARHLLNKSRTSRVVSQSSPPRNPATNSVAVAAASEDARVLDGFSVSPVVIERTAGSTLAYASGSLKNETDKQRFGVTVEIDLFDGSGAKAGAAKDYAAVMEPRAEWKFRALLVKGNVSSARVANVLEK